MIQTMTEAATRASSSSKYQSSHQESVTAATLAKAARPSSAAASNIAAGASFAENTRLQRHRSYHSQSKSQRSKRLDRFQEAGQQPHHRRATSVRVRPTYIEADEDPNLPQPPVSIQVASPEEEEDQEVAKTLGHR